MVNQQTKRIEPRQRAQWAVKLLNRLLMVKCIAAIKKSYRFYKTMPAGFITLKHCNCAMSNKHFLPFYDHKLYNFHQRLDTQFLKGKLCSVHYA